MSLYRSVFVILQLRFSHFTDPFLSFYSSILNPLQLCFYPFTALFLSFYISVFCHFTVPFASAAEIQMRIQAVKIEQIWRFHDGFLVPDVFPIGMSNSSEEIHLRATSTDNFKSHDAPDGNRYCYLCKYYLQFKKIVHI